MSYRYDSEGEVICNIPIISVDVQRELIESALKNTTPEMLMEFESVRKEHDDNYQKYDNNKKKMTNKRPSGYCKSTKHKGVHSASPFVSYNCSECLAVMLMRARSDMYNIDVDILFEENSAESSTGSTTDNSKIDVNQSKIDVNQSKIDVHQSWSENKKISVYLKAGKCIITIENLNEKQNIVNLKFKNFKLVIRPGNYPLIVINDNRYKNQIKGYLRGVPICESLLRGEPCKSLIGPIEPKFKVMCIPRGYAGWEERYDPQNEKNCGQIWNFRKCRACGMSKSSNWSSKSNADTSSKDDIILQLTKELNILRMQNIQLQLQVINKNGS